ncbi:podocalyxin-like protein 2 isoform X2 [Pseudophryne corroboree]|uniref:podocalyxin-like protein 2 isoform X2 n=1 Tax=Pseudophryne corroboree TaxID=495146 RepID=UPI0030812B39
MDILRAWHLWLGLICFQLVTGEEPQSEGLSSTSLLDLPSSLSHLESLDSTEHGSDGFPGPDFQHGLLNTPQGSGFSSQETEEISIFQSPKYFWEDDAKTMNRSNEDQSGMRTDGPETTSTYGATKEEVTNSSSPPNGIPEMSTAWWPTDADQPPRQISPAINVLLEEAAVQPTPQNERTAKSPDTEERTVSKIVSASSTHPTTKPPRKNRKHPFSRSRHVNHEQGTEHWPRPPADSRGLPAANTPGGYKNNEDESSSTQSLFIAKDKKIHIPQLFSTQRDEDPTKSSVPTELSLGSEQEEFRWQKGQQLLTLLEGALSWKSEPPQREWTVFLSKPEDNVNHLLMTVTEEERVLPVTDVFSALADIKRSLAEIGIESYSSVGNCLSLPSPPRSDYGKLFIVLVIIGAICVMIIVAGLIYICWQRRLPKLKNMELHFVENGCHDNPTLDVAMDGQSEMQEKKPSLNGDTSHRADGWETLINKTDKEESDTMEEDTHL